MANSVIQHCSNCEEHPFQDQRYGKNVRVQNPTGKMEKSGQCRCTVCGNVTSIKDKSVSLPKKKD